MVWRTHEGLLVHEGQYKDGQKEGRGKLIGADGRKYDGQWVAGKFHGKGIYMSANGDKKRGYWVEGEFDKWEKENDAQADRPGMYVITHDTKVTATPWGGVGIANLNAGTEVEVMELITLQDEPRLRANIRNPEGWISLLNTETGYRWAANKDRVGEIGVEEVIPDPDKAELAPSVKYAHDQEAAYQEL